MGGNMGDTGKCQMRKPEKSAKTKRLGSVEQDSTMGPNFAYRSICPPMESCWGVPSPNPASVLLSQKQRHPPTNHFHK